MTATEADGRPDTAGPGGGDRVVVRAAATAPALWTMGMLSEQLVGGADTGDQLSASLITQRPGAASPLHVHTREAEAWYLLEGTMTYRAGEQLVRLAAGDFIYLPREVPHAFRVTGTTAARFFALTLPAGLMTIYDEIGVPATERRLPDAGITPTDVQRWLEAAPRYGLRVVGPPLAEDEA